jgi:hypothetical protein
MAFGLFVMARLRRHLCVAAGLILSLVAFSPVGAQRTDLPAPGGRGTIVGIVTDAQSRPVPDVEVRIGSLDRTTRTGRGGSFRFDSVPNGRHVLRARRVGYEAQARTVRMRDDGGVVGFVLAAIPQGLPTVVTSVSRGGLGGIITDEKLQSLPGVEVRMFGTYARTVTDSAGEFFMDVRPGSYMVRLTMPGRVSRLMSVTIPTDSGRRIAIALQPGKRSSNREEIEMQNLAQRLAWRTSPSAFYARERLEGLGDKRLIDIARWVNPGPLSEDTELVCMAVVNGGPDVVPLWYFDADELESVEIYPRGSLTYATGQPRRAASPLNQPRERPVSLAGERGGANRDCPAVYVWLR